MERQRISRTDKQSDEKFDNGQLHAPKHARPTPIHQLQEALGNRAFGEFIQAKLETGAAQSSRAETMERAAAETAQPLDETVRQPLESSLLQDLSPVRVHSGPASAQAAESLGARAYTLGNDIHLGAEANRLSGSAREHLLAHEAVHTVQQGLQSVRPRGQLAVSNRRDAAEIEADHIASSVLRPASRVPSPSLAMREQLRANPVAAHTVSRVAAPLVQRDIIKSDTVQDGTFDLNLVKDTEAATGQTGLKGTIVFTPSATAPNSSLIKLLQVVRTEDLGTAGEVAWGGGEADRNSMQTTANTTTGVQPGYFVDHRAAAATPRTAKSQANVSPYYRTYWPNNPDSRDGSKSGTTVQPASLWDWPKSSASWRFSFETAAKGVNSGYVYAAVRWGFTVMNPGGVISGETATFHRGPSATMGAAVKEFNEFYKNRGASTAP